MKASQMVLEFHKAMDIPYYNCPQIPSKDRIELRSALLNEEVNELYNACVDGDIVEVADGIADCMYILFGTAWEFGLGEILGAVFNEVHRSNMTKLDPATGKPIKRADGKVIKPPTYSPADIKKIVDAAIAARQRH
jgi:predicted HAD superfamily Cof-like phosphohydrolase